jgi:phosphoribosylanthranilate isomerase
MIPRLKVCCIASVDEARLAIRAGASALGLVSQMPSGPGPISDEAIAVIARTVPPPAATFLLTCRTDGSEIEDQVIRCRTNTVQLVDEVPDETYRHLRRTLPWLKIVQVLHVMDETVVEEARRIGPMVDALLLDSGNPKKKTKELGGTGRTHDWSVSRQVVEASPVPVFLAGGLGPRNVAEAIAQVQPFGIDLCTGVRTRDRLDESKLAALVRAIGRG